MDNSQLISSFFPHLWLVTFSLGRGRHIRSKKASLEESHETATRDQLPEIGDERGGQRRGAEPEHHHRDGVLGRELLAQHAGRRATDAEGDEIVRQREAELVARHVEVLHQARRVCIREVAAVQGAVAHLVSSWHHCCMIAVSVIWCGLVLVLVVEGVGCAGWRAYLNKYVTASVGMMIRSALSFRRRTMVGSTVAVASLTSIRPASSSMLVSFAFGSNARFSILDDCVTLSWGCQVWGEIEVHLSPS